MKNFARSLRESVLSLAFYLRREHRENRLAFLDIGASSPTHYYSFLVSSELGIRVDRRRIVVGFLVLLGLFREWDARPNERLTEFK